MLCALMMSAVAAQGANAETKGNTVFTCKKSAVAGTGTLNDAHCKEQGGSKNFEHVGVAAETTTELTGSNILTGTERSTAVLNSTQAGIAEEIIAKKVSPGAGTPWVKNRTTGAEHYIEGEGKLLYSEVEVTKPAGKGCAVVGGQVETKQLRATSMSTEGDPKLAEEMKLKFEPAEGTLFAEFEITGCSTSALNGVYKVEGSLKTDSLETTGATLVSTEAAVTTQGKLTVRGQKAGIGGSLTIEGKDAVDSLYTPLSTTTVNTP
jgi:hypothetical protein